jgi:hypothetical protein
MNTITVPKIRPVSWKVYVQGKEETQYVSGVLRQAGIEVSEPEEEPGLTDPPLYAVVATAKADVPLTEEELLAILEQDDKVELSFGKPCGSS